MDLKSKEKDDTYDLSSDEIAVRVREGLWKHLQESLWAAICVIREHLGVEGAKLAYTGQIDELGELILDLDLDGEASHKLEGAYSFIGAFENLEVCFEELEDIDDRIGPLFQCAYLAGLFAGHLGWETQIPVSMYSLVEDFRKRRENCRKGGKASKRLSPEDEEKALRIIAAKHGDGVKKKTQACKRAADDLLKYHGIEVSYHVLLRLLREQKSDAALSVATLFCCNT